MDIKPADKTIRDLFVSGRQFVIPRFQRDYSWEKKNFQEFFEDMMNNLAIKDGQITSSQYFLGTMLFVGNFAEGTEQEILVVDGQQRLTTITILFSALSDKFCLMGENTLSEQIFKYIMTKDDNGNDVRILKSKTHYPFFAYFIQDRKKGVSQPPSTEEELLIEDTYNYLFQQLSEEKVKSYLKRKHVTINTNELPYVEILKALRDQVLNSTFISISTNDRDQANKIFEILNAKGKRLAHIDLIKNKIFEVLKEQEPADFAEDHWQKIKDTLNTGKENVGLATFYRHFWISKYKKSYSNRLYDDFNSIPKNETAYKQFLQEMLTNAKYYMQIVNPKRDDYNNRKEYFGLVQSLNAINNSFNVVQIRIALLALYDTKERNIIDFKILKDTIFYLENFHFAYNAVLTGRSNRLEKIYSSFAIELRKCTTKYSAQEVISRKLIAPLNGLYPSFEEFSAKFIKLVFSKKENPFNVRTKYAINKLNCYYSTKDTFEDNGSVEHLIPETADHHTLNIGNLILLEQRLNSIAGQESYKNKVVLYAESDYVWVKDFIQKNPDWNESMIEARAIEMSRVYYTNILKKDTST